MTLAANTSYVRGELTSESLKAVTPMVVGDAMFYLALPPGLFGQAVSALGAAGLADEVSGARRLVIEKPFGTSSATAAELHPGSRPTGTRIRSCGSIISWVRSRHADGESSGAAQVGDAAVPR